MDYDTGVLIFRIIFGLVVVAFGIYHVKKVTHLESKAEAAEDHATMCNARAAELGAILKENKLIPDGAWSPRPEDHGQKAS